MEEEKPEIIISEPKPPLSTSFAHNLRIICRVCQKQFSQYTCPRCNTRYCSLPCYKRHSLQCTEAFMRENVVEEMQQIQSNDESKMKMLDILKRVHMEDEMDSDTEYDSGLSEEIVQRVLSGDEVRLEDLSPEEWKRFQRALASGELSKLIEPWMPWWKNPSASSISLSPEGCQLVRTLNEVPESSGFREQDLNEIPAGPANPLPSVKQLMRNEPSPLLAVHLVDILYSYCFTLRLYNGDWQSDPLGVATVALSTSKVMGDERRPETVAEAIEACLEETCSPAYKRDGGFSFAVGVLEDVVCLLSLGTDALICALCDFQRLLEAALKMLKSEMGKKERKTNQKLRSAERKIYFLMCWVHEQPAEAWRSLAGLVEVEKASQSQMSHGAKNFKSERKGTQPKMLIEEVS